MLMPGSGAVSALTLEAAVLLQEGGGSRERVGGSGGHGAGRTGGEERGA